jgi:hypothetical protein
LVTVTVLPVTVVQIVVVATALNAAVDVTVESTVYVFDRIEVPVEHTWGTETVFFTTLVAKSSINVYVAPSPQPVNDARSFRRFARPVTVCVMVGPGKVYVFNWVWFILINGCFDKK